MISLFFFLLSFAHAQADTSCASPRSSIIALIDNLQSGNWDPKLASACFETDNQALKEELAVHLKQTLDSRGYRIKYDNYSEDPNYLDPKSRARIRSARSQC